MRTARPSVAALVLSLLLFSNPAPAQEGEEPWEEWVARLSAGVEFSGDEVQGFKADGKAYMLAKAAWGEDAKGAHFVVKALAKFPDTAQLHFSLTYVGQQLSWLQAEVDQGVATIVFGPFKEKKALVGEYRATVAFFPHLQKKEVLDFPGVPVEQVTVETAVFAGTEERFRAEAASQKEYYESYLKRILILESEQEKNVEGAMRKEKFVIGSEGTNFDVGAWRSWTADWRTKMKEKIAEEMRRESTDTLLAMRYPDAYTILSDIAQWNLLLNQAYSRQVYHAFGRAVHPDDEPGLDEVGLPTIQAKIKELHRRFDEFDWK
ncbi:MAG: hypothetical protein HY720_15790 [Planctomycetes bacterium]|nr:hypothetical protein [Planctomycetota bacterium]